VLPRYTATRYTATLAYRQVFGLVQKFLMEFLISYRHRHTPTKFWFQISNFVVKCIPPTHRQHGDRIMSFSVFCFDKVDFSPLLVVVLILRTI